MELGEVNDARKVTTDDQDFFFVVTNKLDLHYCGLMHIVKSFEVLEAHIAEQIISQILEAGFVLLAFERLLLREEAF